MKLKSLMIPVVASALLVGGSSYAQQPSTTSKTTETKSNDSKKTTTETKIDTGATTHKAKDVTVVGTVKKFEAGKSLTVTVPGKVKKTKKFDLDDKDWTITVAPEVAVGQKVKVIQSKDDTGKKTLTVSKA